MRAAPGLLIAALLLAAAFPALAQDDGYGYSIPCPASRFWPVAPPCPALPACAAALPSQAPPAPLFPTCAAHRRCAHPTIPAQALRSISAPALPLRLQGGTGEGFFTATCRSTVSSWPASASVAHGQAQIAAPIVNLIWDLPLGLPIQPFIGGGIGGAYTAASLSDPTNANTYLTARKWGLAYDASGGVDSNT